MNIEKTKDKAQLKSVEKATKPGTKLTTKRGVGRGVKPGDKPGTEAVEGLFYVETPDLLIHNLARILRSRFGRRAKEHGLARSQWQVLNRLSTQQGITLSKLAEILEVELITAGRVVDSLEKVGWAERHASKTDRRTKLIFLTEAAGDVEAKMHAIADELHEQTYADLSQREYEELYRLLKKVHRSVSEKP